MKRGFVVAVAGGTIVVALLGGCNKASNGSSTAAGGKGSAKLTIDGKDQTISGNIGCTTTGDTTVIGLGDQSKGVIGATIKGSEVQSVGVVLNGTALSYPGQGAEAKLSKDGSKYSITGKVMGVDMSNPMAGPSTHDFAMEVTCP